MGTFVLYICLAGVMLAALARPWIGVVAAYLFVILTPQAIWWWAFGGVRPILWVLAPTLIGMMALLVLGKLDFAPLKTRLNLFLFILWICFIVSSFAGPYVNVDSSYRWYSVEWERDQVNNIFLLYFAAVLLIDTEKKLKYMALIIAISTAYLIYWCNGQYFFQGKFGRIGGPTGLYGSNVYSDENAFAMLFVVGLPFLYYLGLYYKGKIIRYGLWLIIPWGWHAVFLTGSRGGLVGLAVTLLVMAFRSTRKIVGVGLILLFGVAFQWQAGDLMKGRADTIVAYEGESSAETRIQAWTAAIGMIAANPLTGVGLASFGAAFSDYSNDQPREAHNTFLHITAESGIIAGVMYLLIIFVSLAALCKRGKTLEHDHENNTQKFLFIINEAVLTSLIGLVTCSLFLSLQVYEIFYFFCVLVGSLSLVYKREAEQSVCSHADKSALMGAAVYSE